MSLQLVPQPLEGAQAASVLALLAFHSVAIAIPEGYLLLAVTAVHSYVRDEPRDCLALVEPERGLSAHRTTVLTYFSGRFRTLLTEQVSAADRFDNILRNIEADVALVDLIHL